MNFMLFLQEVFLYCPLNPPPLNPPPQSQLGHLYISISPSLQKLWDQFIPHLVDLITEERLGPLEN